jgi:nucleolin
VAAIVDVQNEENIGIHSQTEVVAAEIPRKRKRKISTKTRESLNNEGSEEKEKPRKVLCSSVERNNPKVALEELDSEKVLILDHFDSGNLCNDKTVYIEGLPYDSTEADILSFFEACGRVQSIRLPKWHDSGRLRGYGHVQFLSAEAVTKALDLDGEF